MLNADSMSKVAVHHRSGYQVLATDGFTRLTEDSQQDTVCLPDYGDSEIRKKEREALKAMGRAQTPGFASCYMTFTA